jgi:hypothetical protein
MLEGPVWIMPSSLKELLFMLINNVLVIVWLVMSLAQALLG